LRGRQQRSQQGTLLELVAARAARVVVHSKSAPGMTRRSVSQVPRQSF
jgi:hypothetical protein